MGIKSDLEQVILNIKWPQDYQVLMKSRKSMNNRLKKQKVTTELTALNTLMERKKNKEKLLKAVKMTNEQDHLFIFYIHLVNIYNQFDKK